ncbi:polycystin-1-like protein 3 [Odontesthes bonariensis]
METTEGQPTDNQRENFIQKLQEGVSKLNQDNVNQDIIQSILGVCTGIQRLSMKKCDVDTNPNPTSLFQDVFKIMQTASMLVSPAGNTPTVFRYPTGNIYLSAHEPADLNNAVLGSESDGVYIKLPSYSALAPHLKSHKKITAQVATFSDNPYPSDDNITGSVCDIQISDGNSKIKLENLEESIEIFLNRPNSSTVMNNTFVLKRDSRLLTTFTISDPEMTIIFNIEPSVDVSLSLLLSYGSPPNSTHFSNKTTMNTTDGYRWMITPEMLLQTPGTWYIDTRLESDQSETEVAMMITSYLSKCMYWHTAKQSWSTYGCRVGNKSTPERTQCLCNHLTLFGSSFFVMPNHVDISRTAELFATVSENYVVLALLCAFFGLYLMTLLWACYADRKARFKRKMTLLKDNHPGALYNYLISVQTGHRKNAGTSANNAQ